MSKTFKENVISIKDQITTEQLTTLAVLIYANDPIDVHKKEAIADMLSKEYNQALDWLYSTLHGQQSTKSFTLHRVFVCDAEISIVFMN